MNLTLLDFGTTVELIILVVVFNKNGNDTSRFILKNIMTFLNHSIYADAHKYAYVLSPL